MQTEEIVKLTRERLIELLQARTESAASGPYAGRDRRRCPRWPFPGAVELSPAGDDGRTRWFATFCDLSPGGLGVVADCPFAAGAVLDLSCHLPEATLVGRATVRHCEPVDQGYMIGLQFDFDE